MYLPASPHPSHRSLRGSRLPDPPGDRRRNRLHNLPHMYLLSLVRLQRPLFYRLEVHLANPRNNRFLVLLIDHAVSQHQGHLSGLLANPVLSLPPCHQENHLPFPRIVPLSIQLPIQVHSPQSSLPASQLGSLAHAHRDCLLDSPPGNPQVSHRDDLAYTPPVSRVARLL